MTKRPSPPLRDRSIGDAGNGEVIVALFFVLFFILLGVVGVLSR